MNKPTPDHIAAEIAALEDAKTYAPRRTAFGGDNHGKIDRQIEYLRGEIDLSAPEWDDFSEDEQTAILEAQSWKDGQSDESPSSGWDIYKKDV
jgi:hypothetical protein